QDGEELCLRQRVGRFQELLHLARFRILFLETRNQALLNRPNHILAPVSVRSEINVLLTEGEVNLIVIFLRLGRRWTLFGGERPSVVMIAVFHGNSISLTICEFLLRIKMDDCSGFSKEINVISLAIPNNST